MAFNEASSFIDLKAQVRGIIAKKQTFLNTNALLKKELQDLEEQEFKTRGAYKKALQNQLLQQSIIAESSANTIKKSGGGGGGGSSSGHVGAIKDIKGEGGSSGDKGDLLSEAVHSSGGFDALFIEFNSKLELQILNSNMKTNLALLEKLLNESTARTWKTDKDSKASIEYPDKINSVYCRDLRDLDGVLRREVDSKAKLKERMMATINRLKETRVKLSKDANVLRKDICDTLDDREFLYRSKVTTLKAVSIEESRYKFLSSEFIRVRNEIDALAFNPNGDKDSINDDNSDTYDWVNVAFEEYLSGSTTGYISRADVIAVVENWFPPHILDDVSIETLMDNLSRGFDIQDSNSSNSNSSSGGVGRRAGEGGQRTRPSEDMYHTGLNIKEIKILFNYLGKIN